MELAVRGAFCCELRSSILSTSPNPGGRLHRAQLFGELAEANPDLWSLLQDRNVTHNTFGDGIVTNLVLSRSNSCLFVVEFSTGPKKFGADALRSGFFSIVFPREIEDLIDNLVEERRLEEARRAAEVIARQVRQEALREEQWLAEAERSRQAEASRKEQNSARQEYRMLLQKYGIARQDANPLTRLFVILKKLDAGEDLEEVDHQFLRKEAFPSISAQYFRARYERQRDPWNLVRACSYWRKARESAKALELIDWTLSIVDRMLCEPSFLSAAFTTRGGALRDMRRLSEAENSAKEALGFEQNYFSYNLLGAIYYQKGEPQEGDRYFEQARKLGSGDRAVESSMRSALDLADDPRGAAEYLLKKDRDKYGWAMKYLTSVVNAELLC